MARIPKIRVNTPVTFPTLVQGSGPVTVTKKNGIWTIGLAGSAYGPPSLTVLGGLYANPGQPHKWVYSINNDGTVTLTQPTYADIAGTPLPSRPALTANLSLYVNPSTGNDGNNGLTAGTAFATLLKAWGVVCGYDLNNKNVSINLAAGTETGGISSALAPVGTGTIFVVGAGSGTTTISVPASQCFLIAPSTPVTVSIQGVTLTSTGGHGIIASGYGVLVVLNGDVNFGVVAGDHMYATAGGRISVTTPYTISGGAYSHMFAQQGGQILLSSIAVTISANVAISIFASADQLGIVSAYAVTYALGGHTVTATRYYATGNSIIYTNAGGANYFPGTIAGSTATGGQYT